MKIVAATLALLACLVTSAGATHETEQCPTLLYGTVMFKGHTISVSCVVYGRTVSCS